MAGHSDNALALPAFDKPTKVCIVIAPYYTAISQAQLFHDAIGLTGLTISKLDGTAKGGVIFGIADRFKLPIRYIGVGESIDDLRPFHAEEFVDALFHPDDAE